jgi:hypothetical protein
MNPRPILDSLPAEFSTHTSARAWLAVRRSAESALASSGYGLESDGKLATSALAGRKPLRELQTSEGVLLVRRFSHGGLLRALTRDRFFDPTRPFREIQLAEHLRQAGVDTPEIIAARARRLPVAGWQLDLVTRRVECALDLGWVLGMARRGEVARVRLRRTWRALGEFVGRLHAHGFLHADLTPNNVLVNADVLAGAPPHLVLLDLDRAQIVPRVDDYQRRANLRRFLRFVMRREQRDGRALARTDFLRFWLFEGVFGPGRDPREIQVRGRPRTHIS